MISKDLLVARYQHQGQSAAVIATALGCSQNKVHYWLERYRIKKRTISEALYLKHNPTGDPFKFKEPKSHSDWFMYGLGLGLYWGEGNKRSKTALRIGNTDPDLLKVFLKFLIDVYNIDISRLRFGLQIFTDTEPKEAVGFWCRTLQIPKSQFQKVVITRSNRKGTYFHKSKYGVLTIYFSNTKIRDTIIGAIDRLRTTS